jgi:hypothetical protein
MCVNGTCSVSFASIDSNATVRNVSKHDFWVQSSGSGVFIAKNFEATSFIKIVR